MAVAGIQRVGDEHSSPVEGAEPDNTNSTRICDRALDALALTQARLAWLEGRSTSERLPGGYWLVLSPENLLEKLIELAVQVKAVVHGVREALREQLAPAWRHDFVARLHALRRRFSEETGIECEVDVDAERALLGQRACEAVYWMLNELLANVRKHANATRVSVSSGRLDERFIYFRVEDDGLGMRVPGAASGPEYCGLGLWNVEQHLNELGGSIELESDHGLRVTIALPRS